ncbi:WD-40 repeat-containing protein [Desulfurispirillum indicum S5]|uniref:WD-40 repeat-containing protein n=1 Tax=Desulfurispirillum indicum (strain ATCC BAA-1389 / DSM 22839 / S5) TaxID=653733 RepID=E6W5Q0_DESIS|nr:BamA/TamA family outer membrane protein [Desulfurispirillum indicum]ADU66081.1 WD-40 repeat-containing protein [Desulfurispirillum indicum S5]
MSRIRPALVFLLIFTILRPDAGAAITPDPWVSWQTLRTAHFTIHHAPETETFARQTAALAEEIHLRLTPFFNWQPTRPTEVVITDSTDFPNGFASVFPSNRIVIYMAPPDAIDGLENSGNWLETLLLHEYTHILHMDKVRGLPQGLRQVFGRNFLLFPAYLQPLWVLEGLAIHHESDHMLRTGRVFSSYSHMQMRLETMAGIKDLHQVNQPMVQWPGAATPYLYGTHFFRFLHETRGEDSIRAYVEDYSGQILDITRLQGAARRAYGQSMSHLWQEFDLWLQEQYTEQLASLEARGLREGNRISHFGYFTGGTASLQDEVYFVRHDGHQRQQLMAYDVKRAQLRSVAPVRSSRFSLHPKFGILITQPAICNNRNWYMDIYHIDPDSGHSTRLTKCQRYRYATLTPDAEHIIAVQHQAGQSSLHLLNRDGVLLRELWQGEPGEVPAHMVHHPHEDWLLISMWRQQQGWNLERFDLRTAQWTPLIRRAGIQAHPHFDHDGSHILFSSDSDGIYNIHQYSLESGETTVLTNVRGGAFHPARTDAGLFYIGFHSGGADLYHIADPSPQRHHSEATPERPLPRSQPDPHQGSVSAYSPWQGLQPRWWFPVALFDDDHSELGFITSGEDALGRHRYALQGSYDFEQEWLLGRAEYEYRRFWPHFSLGIDRSASLRRNNDGDVIAARKSQHVQAETMFPFLRTDWRSSVHLGVSRKDFHERSRHALYPSSPDRVDESIGLALHSSNAQQHFRQILPSQGRTLLVVAEDSSAFSGDFRGRTYTASWKEYLALTPSHRQTLHIKGYVGWGDDDSVPFQLGGSTGSSGSLLGSSVFLRRGYPLRGYPEGLQHLHGRRMVLGSLEWNFPLATIERGFITPPLGAGQVWGTLFAEQGAAWNTGSSPQQYSRSIGAEIHGDLFVYYHLGIRATLGVARGLDEGGEDRVYLRAGLGF